jgi:ubiquinone/menaquinone biosynthesis C-methylase UbiE
MKIDPDKEEAKTISSFNCEGKEILEIGCGNGRLSLLLADKAKSFVGIDPDRKAIAAADKKVTKNFRDKTSFEVGRSSKLRFDDDSFDIVFMGMSLHEIPTEDRKKSLGEIKRVLRKDGRLIIIEPKAHGEIQSIYCIFLFKLFKDNHKKKIETARKNIDDSINEGMFNLEVCREFDTKWIFKDSKELFAFFLKEHKITKDKGYFVEEMKRLLAKKIGDSPLIARDELIVVELRNLK